ncbi:MAG: patatin-like phospholipase family protein [Comamonas sp.]
MTLEPRPHASANPSATPRRPINLALQGGGSHGAFTWGVLDTLLADERLEIEGVSGASAGAVNAVALAHGFAQAQASGADGRVAARAALRSVWEAVIGLGSLGAIQSSLLKMVPGLDMPMSMMTGALNRLVSPYQSNPLDINPLRSLLLQRIDFEAVSRLRQPRVFVSATQVTTGKVEVFEGARLTLQAVMASACLPMMFRAVEIDGQAYWDGGYSGNPAITPLISQCATRDILLVQLSALRRPQTPQTPADIMDRISELTFNSSLLSQMRIIDFINRLLEKGRLSDAHYKHVLLHRIDGGEALAAYPVSTKLSTDPAMIQALFELGQQAAQAWLNQHLRHLGVKSTVDIRQDYLDDMQLGF